MFVKAGQNGSLYGYQNKYIKIKRMTLVNGPLMFNYQKTKEGALYFKGKSIYFILDYLLI